MNDDFADWYRRVDIEPKSEDLQKRWQAIEVFHQKATASDLTEVTRLFFGLRPREEDFLAKYRAEFKATDHVFPMRDNDAELQALAGATLANYFGHNDDWAILTALAVTCGANQGGRKAPVAEIVSLAESTLRERSSSLRTAQKKAVIPLVDLSEKVQNLKTTLQGGGSNFQALQGPLLDILQPLLKAVSGVTTWVMRADLIQDLRQEETDVLWWLFGETSRDLEVPFRDLKSPSACIIGAKELADLTRVLPGPYGAEAFLHKMIGLAHPSLGESVSLSDATLACPEEWQNQFIAVQRLDSVIDLCPVHLAVKKCVESRGKRTAWHSLFQTASGLKATQKFHPVALALQAYRERLFVRVMDNLEESADE